MVAILLAAINAFQYFPIPWLLTRGGPASRTEIFPHLAYQTALGARRLGMGAAVSLVFFPVLVIPIVLLTRRMLRERED